MGSHTFQRRTLSNGLQVLAIRDPTNRSATASIFVVYGAGKRMESTLTTGIAHLTEHAMYAGTARTPASAHDARIHALGGESNAFTRRDFTLYYDDHLPVSAIDEILALEADRLRGLTFEPEAFEHERERLLREEESTASEAARRDELLESLLFRAHPYGSGLLDVGGHTLAARLTREQVQQFYDLWYQPDRVAVVIAGDLDPDDALASAERAFAAIPAGPPAPPIPTEPDDAPGGEVTAPSPTLTAPRVSIAWVGPALNDGEAGQRDRVALELLARSLSKHRGPDGSPFDASMGDGVDRDLFVVSATGHRARAKAERLIAQARDQGLDPESLDRERLSIRSLAEQQPLISSRPYFSLAGVVGADAAVGLPDRSVRLAAELSTITSQDVQRAARRWLSPRRAWIVTFEPSDPNAATQPLPDDPKALQRYAEEAADSGRIPRAIAAYEKLVASNPGRMWSVIYLYELGSLRIRHGDLAAARRDLERALTIVDYPAVRDRLEELNALEADAARPRGR